MPTRSPSSSPASSAPRPARTSSARARDAAGRILAFGGVLLLAACGGAGSDDTWTATDFPTLGATFSTDSTDSTNESGSPTSDAAIDAAIDADWVRARYEKTEHLVPMRDGTRLHTVVYAPRGVTGPRPVLLHRTPYSCRPYGPDAYRGSLGPDDAYARDGYVFVYQDVRGRYLSEGTFVNMRPHVARKRDARDVDESTDGYDTVAWIVENVPNHNGRVGMWGISYPGFYAAASMIDAHPNLVAVSPQAPIADWWYDDFHHHGALFLPHGFHFISAFGQPREGPTTGSGRRPFKYPTVDGYDFYLNHVGALETLRTDAYVGHGVPFWNALVEHPNYDEFWQSRNIVPHLDAVAPAVLTVGGWFDAEDLYGPLAIYQSIEAQDENAWNGLVMGPWRHGGWARTTGESLGDQTFAPGVSDFYHRFIEKPFFDHHLDGGPDPELPEAFVYETGGNRWHRFDAWPPRTVRRATLHPGANGALSFEPATSADRGFDEYVSDPAKPVPYTEEVSVRMVSTYMTEDQRFASTRPDVLVYRTEPLTEDVTLAGPILANLWVSTSGTASDWVVKLIDEYPGLHPDEPSLRDGKRSGGAQMMVRSEVIRGRFRESPSEPKPFVPNEPTNVRLPLQDVLHTFRKGHRIMIHVQSTWFPLVDRNPQTYLENPYLATEDDFVPATQRLYRSGPHRSTIEVGVIPASRIDETVDARFGR